LSVLLLLQVTSAKQRLKRARLPPEEEGKKCAPSYPTASLRSFPKIHLYIISPFATFRFATKKIQQKLFINTIQNKISNFDSWLDFDLLKKNEPNVSI
jgi:hypothetical protein